MRNKSCELFSRFPSPELFAGLDEKRDWLHVEKSYGYAQKLSSYHIFHRRPSQNSFQTSQTNIQRVSRDARSNSNTNRIQIQENLLNYMTR